MFRTVFGDFPRRLANEPFSGRERAAFDRRHQRFRGAVAQGAISVRITVKEGSDVLASGDDRLTSTYQAAVSIKQVEVACPGCVDRIEQLVPQFEKDVLLCRRVPQGVAKPWKVVPAEIRDAPLPSSQPSTR